MPQEADADGDDEQAEDYSAAETDWLAHSVYGYGYGYTKEQALIGMAGNIRAVDSELQVDLVEHVGDAQTGAMGWRVDECVQRERLYLPADEFNEMRMAALDVIGATEGALVEAHDEPEDERED